MMMMMMFMMVTVCGRDVMVGGGFVVDGLWWYWWDDHWAGFFHCGGLHILYTYLFAVCLLFTGESLNQLTTANIPG